MSEGSKTLARYMLEVAVLQEQVAALRDALDSERNSRLRAEEQLAAAMTAVNEGGPHAPAGARRT